MTINDPFYARGYKAFRFYLAVKLHATTDSYDIFRYNAAVSAKEDSYLKRNDKYWFAKIGKQYTSDTDLMNFFVANWIEGGELNWVGKLTDVQAQQHFKAWMKRQESLTYTFKKDMEQLLEEYERPNVLTKSIDGRMPPLLMELQHGSISIESVVILDALTGCLEYMTKQMVHDEYVFPKVAQKIRKYAPFVTYDRSKVHAILTSIVEEKLDKAA